MKFTRTILPTVVVVLAPLIAVPELYSTIAPSSPEDVLSTDQVVDNLVHQNEDRTRVLQHSEATRIYHLVYNGLFGHREAEMTVRASYDSPSTKHFQVISQSGSAALLKHVLRRLLANEVEAAQPSVKAQTLLNRANYDFDLAGVEHSTGTMQYVLQVRPKSRSKYVYRGKVWVDGTDFAVTRIEAEPSKNPSFWTRKVKIHHEYKKIQCFWLPVRNESVTHVWLGGRATLTIDYKDYRVIDARHPGEGHSR